MAAAVPSAYQKPSSDVRVEIPEYPASFMHPALTLGSSLPNISRGGTYRQADNSKRKLVTIHHITGTEGIMIQNDGKQDVFQQLQGWIHACFEL